MAHFKWKKEYSVGVKKIDDQHKQLIAIIDRLRLSIEGREIEENLKDILRELDEYTLNHFSLEEKYFDEFNYKNAAEHKKQHQSFINKMNYFESKIKNNEIEISFELIDFLEDWWIYHLQNQDQKYVKCFKEHGLS